MTAAGPEGDAREPVRVLLLAPEPSVAPPVEEVLEAVEMPLDLHRATGAEGARAALADPRLELALVDVRGADDPGAFPMNVVARGASPPTAASVVLVVDDDAGAAPEGMETGVDDRIRSWELEGPGLERALRLGREISRRRRLEARTEALVGNARELVSVVGPDGELLYVSPSLPRVLGFHPDEKTGASSLMEVHPDDRDEVAEALASVLAEPGGTRHLRYRVRHADGSWRVLDTLAENHLHDPAVGGVVVSSWDVTEVEEQARRVRLQARLLEEVGQAVIATDPSGRVFFWNRRAEAMYGWSFREAEGRSILELTPSDASREEAREIMEELAAGHRWSGEVVLRRKDGTTFPALVANAPILDDHGELQGIVGVSSDISELKETERELRERLKELRTLNEAARILHEVELPLGARCEALVEAVPPGFQYPELTEARIVVEDVSAATPGFRPGPRMLEAPVETPSGRRVGSLAVVLTGDPDPGTAGGFLEEEGELLRSLAAQVGSALERHQLTGQLRQTFASLEEAVLLIDTAGEGRRIRSVNPAAERIFGYTSEEMVGRTTEFLHVDSEAFHRFGREGDVELETEGVFHASYPLRRKDGTVFPAEQTVSVLEPGRGLPGGAVSVIRDLTEARRAQAELRRSERRFRELAERITDVFWISSPDKGTMEYVSPAYETIWGRPVEPLYDDPRIWMDAVHPHDRPRVRDFARLQAEGERTAEYRIVRPDGEVRWIQDRSFPVAGPDGGVERVVGVAEDVTERKKAEERLGILSREITEVIYILSPDGTVTYATPSVEPAAGYTRGEFEGMNALELVHPDDRERVEARLAEVAAVPGSTVRASYRIVRRDGEVRHVESVARNLLHRSGIEGILLTSRDVTERVELQETLQQSQRLEAIGRLAGGIAHDFNNLLTVIRSQTDLLLLDLPEGEETARELQVVQTAADRAATLTNQLLAFSRDQVLRPRIVDLCAVVRDTVGLVERVIGEDVRVETELPGDRDSVAVDPAQLEQVVLNLAINARDAMPEGGTLRLRTFETTVGARGPAEEEGPGRYTVLEVSDTGVGMPDGVRSRIFEPFFTTKGEEGGTGLGLAMAYGFVTQSGGFVEVESEPGEGSTFRLHFPTARGEPEDVAPPRRDSAGDAELRATVLVVEDDESVRRVTGRILERAGLTVVRAADAETGLRRLREREDIALVLTDLVLPGLSGRALVDRIRTAEPDLPLVVMSGYAADSPGHRGDLPPEIPFIQKPFTPGALLDTVRGALAGNGG